MLFSVGHSNRTLQELVALLGEADISQLVDIRSYPGSRRHPHFSRAALERALPQYDIAYRWMPELGGMRENAADSVHTALLDSGFTGYADYMLTDVFIEAARSLCEHASQPTAMMCAEARPEQCHRRYLCDWLVTHDTPVEHLVGPGERLAHELNPIARRDGGRLLYDRGQLSLL